MVSPLPHPTSLVHQHPSLWPFLFSLAHIHLAVDPCMLLPHITPTLPPTMAPYLPILLILSSHHFVHLPPLSFQPFLLPPRFSHLYCTPSISTLSASSFILSSSFVILYLHLICFLCCTLLLQSVPAPPSFHCRQFNGPKIKIKSQIE